jgi:hypothetical protein
MQHIKAYMSKIERMIKEGAPKKQEGESKDNDKNIRIVAKFVEGIREAREGKVNGK